MNTFANVQTIYILRSGEQISSREELESVKDRFDWLDKTLLLTEMLHVRSMTNTSASSIIAIFEENRSMKTFLNIASDFHLNDLVCP
jgi:hypothetical protein